MDYELRTVEAEEIRLEESEAGPIIRTSIKFNTLSEPLGFFTKFREKIADTAFDGAINNESREVLAFWNHNSDMPLGRRSETTVSISKTKTLFKAEIKPGDTTWGQDAVKSIRRRDVKGVSFGFRVLPEGDKWEEDDDRNLIRTLNNVELIEISPTAMPAYPDSSASIRTLFEEKQREFQKRASGNGAETSAAIATQVADRQRRERLQRQSIRHKS